MVNTIKCKNCGAEIEVSEALTHKLEEEVLKTLEVKHARDVEEAVKKVEEATLKKLEQKFSQDLDSAKKEAEEEKERNNKLLSQLENLNDEMRKLRRKDEERELEMKRRLADEEDKIRKEASGKAVEEQKFVIKEKNLKIEQLMKDIEEMKRKVQEGSQQAQGEVLELDLEEKLRANFIYDEISPIGKGVQGADIVQKVKNQSGKVAGIILWETKRAKWTPSWIPKLKEDGRKNDATMVVLVS